MKKVTKAVLATAANQKAIGLTPAARALCLRRPPETVSPGGIAFTEDRLEKEWT